MAHEKQRLLNISENIKKLQSNLEKAVDFMNTTFELIMDESEELKGKVSMLVNENKVLNDQLNLKDMKEDTTNLSSHIDYLERNLKGINVEISGRPFK